MYRKLILCVSSVIFASLSLTAYTQNIVDASDPEAILNIAKGFGSAKLDIDDYGDPIIEARIEGIRYSVIFNGCDNGQDCAFILFSAGWAYDDSNISIETLNQWNYESNFGKAYLDDENDPILELPVNLTFGVTHDNLDDTFDWWRTILIEFSTTVLDSADNENYNRIHTI